LEKSNRFPDVEVNFFVERERSSYPAAGLDRNTLAGLGFSIPIPFRQRNADDMEQARFDRIEAEATSEALRFRVRNEYAQAFRARLDAWRLAREASGEILQLAAKNVADFQAAYRQGQASLLQTQRVQEQLLELKNAALEAIVNYHLAKARMREVVGDYPKTKPILKQVSPRK
jgi:cobalt-zinc-cadmium efflux system outer membrane protein